MALSSRSGEAALQEGEARITAAVRLREKAAAASEQTFRLYRNGQLEETIPAASGQESGTWEGTGTVSCAARGPAGGAVLLRGRPGPGI